jgi:hypothetical protein
LHFTKRESELPWRRREERESARRKTQVLEAFENKYFPIKHPLNFSSLLSRALASAGESLNEEKERHIKNRLVNNIISPVEFFIIILLLTTRKYEPRKISLAVIIIFLHAPFLHACVHDDDDEKSFMIPQFFMVQNEARFSPDRLATTCSD